MLIQANTRYLNRGRNFNLQFQSGVTLIETMISLALSLIVTSAMVILMANTMGTSTRIINMTQLTDEMRNVMSMMTRDIRRANYSANAIYCYGHSNCGSTVAVQTSGINIVDTADVQCVTFQLDRSYIDAGGAWQEMDGNASNDPKGGFRRREIPVDGDDRGIIEMWINNAAGNAMPACDPGVEDGWVAVTDPNSIDILEFTIDDGLSQEETITRESGASFTQRQRQLKFAIEGELVIEQKMGWVKTNDPIMVRRRIEDSITVRNDYIKDYIPAS
jgi:type II secretory pathway component PulJ